MGISPTLNIPQARFLAMQHKFKAYVAGFGSGKTWVGCGGICKGMWEHPKINQGYFAPTYPQIRDIFYPTIEEVAFDWGLSVKINEGNKEVHFYEGRRYRGTTICRSMEKPGSIVGFKIGNAMVRQAICSYAARSAEKLRGEHQYCRFISAFVKTSPFALNEPYYGNSASMKLLTPTQDSRDIINAAVKCLDKIWQDGHRYQKAGILLGDFFSQGVAQLNLFDENAPRAGSERLMEVLDYLNAKDGKGTLYFAGQGIQQQWQMKRDMLSPRYTTRYSDLIKVR
nr:DUF4113 domain-containing protein [Enterobacter mori]